MQNENNNPLHWKQKLENIDSFPADMRINEKDAWRKLEDKLKHKPKRSNAMLYWAAAACLLPLLLLLPPSFHSSNHNIAKQIFHLNEAKKQVEIYAQLTKKKDVTGKAIVVSNKKKRVVKKWVNKEEIASKIIPVFIDTDADSVAQSKVVKSSNSNDSNRLIAAKLPPLIKKLKVVHINELNEPAEVTPMIAHNLNHRFFLLPIARGEVVGNNINAAHTTSFVSLKSKSLTN